MSNPPVSLRAVSPRTQRTTPRIKIQINVDSTRQRERTHWIGQETSSRHSSRHSTDPPRLIRLSEREHITIRNDRNVSFCAGDGERDRIEIDWMTGGRLMSRATVYCEDVGSGSDGRSHQFVRETGTRRVSSGLHRRKGY